jgi:hypothetical protein
MDDFKKGIFIWIPKVAGTSISEALSVFRHYRTIGDLSLRSFNGNRDGVVSFGHVDIMALRQEKIVSAGFYKSAFKFCFVRNPYDRAISLFHWFRRNPGFTSVGSGSTFRQFCNLLDARRINPIGLYNVDGLSQANPQACWVPRGIDFIGRFENLEEDFLHVCKQLGLGPVRLSWKKRQPGDYSRMDFYRDKTCIRSVRQFYRADFKKFNYSTDPKNVD